MCEAYEQRKTTMALVDFFKRLLDKGKKKARKTIPVFLNGKKVCEVDNPAHKEEKEEEEVVVKEVIGENNKWMTKVVLHPEFLPSATNGGEPFIDKFDKNDMHTTFHFNHINLTWNEIRRERKRTENCSEFLLSVYSSEEKDKRFPYKYSVSGSVEQCCESMMKLLGDFISNAKGNPDGYEAMSIPCIELIINALAETMLGNGSIAEEIEFNREWENELVELKKKWNDEMQAHLRKKMSRYKQVHAQ